MKKFDSAFSFRKFIISSSLPTTGKLSSEFNFKFKIILFNNQYLGLFVYLFIVFLDFYSLRICFYIINLMLSLNNIKNILSYNLNQLSIY